MNKFMKLEWLFVLAMVLVPSFVFAGEADLVLPPLTQVFNLFGSEFGGRTLLEIGLVVCALGGLFGLIQYAQVKKIPAHKSMLEVSELIYTTCKAYLQKQGKFIAILEAIMAVIIVVYFYGMKHMEVSRVGMILIFSVLGILGSYFVAWFGIRMNTLANSRTAFSSLRGKPFPTYAIPLKAGMSIGMLLISVELIMMLGILLYVPSDLAGVCFLGFAIGESLGASALRICGGIFTKIADIGSDLMKIVFKIKEDDARNPGVIADCVGDNAGDSVGPSADGFETYGVTGVALITFIVLAVADPGIQAMLLVWVFVMRIMMVLTSMVSYKLCDMWARAKYLKADTMDFEHPLTVLVWATSLISIVVTYVVSHELLKGLANPDLWWILATIISFGTLAGAIIPEVTKVFTSAKSKHVQEITDSSREGGASLNILSGLVAGNFSAFWMGMVIAGIMAGAFFASQMGVGEIMSFPAVFAFGLVAFGFLGMGPVTIAVDSYGPVTDNAQSVFELSTIESEPGISQSLEKEFGFKPQFEKGKQFLEENDGAGNTFKATAKPVLIGTAVVGATTMIFSIILMLQKTQEYNLPIELINPWVTLGLIAGGSVIYWFTGASMQAVTTGAYRAVEFIKKNIKLDTSSTKASVADSTRVVEICTQYAQNGMFNIFMAVFFMTLGFACIHPFFFVAYLVMIATTGLFQAIFMANAGGAWDNAKKVVETVLREKNTPLHDASVVGDTVGDPFKDTSSVALNPIIKFTTLFGLLAVELSVELPKIWSVGIAVVCLAIGFYFVWASFYKMRIRSSN